MDENPNSREEQELMSITKPDAQSRRFTILSDKNRVRILQCLKKNPKTVTEIVSLLDLERTVVSHHLRILRQDDIIIGRKDGRFIRYELNSNLIDGEFFDFGCCKIEFTTSDHRRR